MMKGVRQYQLCTMGLYETAWIKESGHTHRTKSLTSFSNWFRIYKVFSGLK